MGTRTLDDRPDALAQAALVHAGDATPIELVDAAIARIEALDPLLNAVITHDFERARQAAAEVDPRLPFAGVPVLIKDLCAEVDGQGRRGRRPAAP